MYTLDEAAKKMFEYAKPALDEAAAKKNRAGKKAQAKKREKTEKAQSPAEETKEAASPQYEYDPKESPLVEALYRAYVRLAPGNPDYETLLERDAMTHTAVKGKLRNSLIPWYCDRFEAPGPEKTGGRAGVDRGVKPDVVFGEADYRFDEPMTRSVLEKYLLRGEGLRTADFRDFILHMAVAFRLTPETLDKLLMAYGFHRLHVKNVHHMAIYAVLRELETGSLPPDTDAFAAVKECFEKARKLLKDTSGQPGSARSAGADPTYSTRFMENELSAQRDLTRARVLEYIAKNPELYGMRHVRLLAEHKRLAYLFGELYDPHRADWTREGDTTASVYCFYRFLNEFCKKTERKHFNEQIFNWIQREGRHPTRELMIALWTYAFCFLFTPVIDVRRPDGGTPWCDAKTVPFSARTQAAEEETPFADYQDRTQEGGFRVLDYLRCSAENGAEDKGDKAGILKEEGSEAPAPAEKPSARKDTDGSVYGTVLSMDYAPAKGRGFSGEQLLAFINGKLQSYSWRSLDKRDPFDAIVQALGPLEYGNGRDGTPCWFFDGQRLKLPAGLPKTDVPAPLALITELLHRVQTVNGGPFSPDFKCYELV